MENSKKNGYLCNCLLPWQQSAIYSYERKWNPRCVANLHCECQEHKSKVEINTSFLVLHPSPGVETVGSHLNCGKNKKVAHEAIAECVTDVSYHILTFSVIYYSTDARQHRIYLFYIIKKQKAFWF